MPLENSWFNRVLENAINYMPSRLKLHSDLPFVLFLEQPLLFPAKRCILHAEHVFYITTSRSSSFFSPSLSLPSFAWSPEPGRTRSLSPSPLFAPNFFIRADILLSSTFFSSSASPFVIPFEPGLVPLVGVAGEPGVAFEKVADLWPVLEDP